MDNNKLKAWLSILVTLAFIGATFALMSLPLPVPAKDILLILIGALVSRVGDVYAYYFGSSEGSARKTEFLNAPSPLALGYPEDHAQSGHIRLGLLHALLLLGLLTLPILAHADDTPAAAATTEATEAGWGPSAMASVGAFYLNGDYRLLQAGVAAGAAYTLVNNKNVSSIGAYLGPQASQTAGKSDTSLVAIIYGDLFKTSAGRFGLGLGTGFWRSGDGFISPSRNNTFIVLGYKF